MKGDLIDILTLILIVACAFLGTVLGNILFFSNLEINYPEQKPAYENTDLIEYERNICELRIINKELEIYNNFLRKAQ